MMRSIRFWEGMKKMFCEGLDKLLVDKTLIRFQLVNNPHVSPPAVCLLQILNIVFQQKELALK